MKHDGERLAWWVPRGFGEEYKRAIVNNNERAERVADLLGLIGLSVTVEQVRAWPFRRQVDAEVYAINVHLRASDNAIQACPRPERL